MTLYQGNCFDVLCDLPPASVDLILVDLPYGTTQNKWDIPIDLAAMWQEIRRVRKPAAPSVMFAAQPFTSRLVMSNVSEFKYDWVWRKPKGTGHLNAKKQPMRDKEDVLVFYDSQCLYNPQFTKGEPYLGTPRAGSLTRAPGDHCYGGYGAHRNDNEGVRYPKQVLEFPFIGRGSVHPTQKPTELLAYLIRTYTQPGDTVLDFTMGSGSTGVACAQENRKFIGVEIDPAYFKIAIQRISEANSLDFSPLL